MDKDDIKFGGFSPLFDVLGGSSIGKDGDDINVDITEDDIDELKDDSKKDDKSDKDQNQKQPKSKKEVAVDTDEDDDDASDDTDNDTDEDPDNNEENSNEAEQVKLLFSALSESLGIDTSEDDNIPTDVEGLVEYMKDVVEENSKPQYSSKEVEEIDEYVRNGGNISDYIAAQSASVDYDTIDIEDESNQKRVLKDFLAKKGLSNTVIQKKISKYEDAGILSDEAEDALDALKDITKNEKEELLNKQQLEKQKIIQSQHTFIQGVVDEVRKINDIRGIKIPEKDKAALLEYMFKQESDGTTKYQKDYAKSNRNLIESAYFTMKGDSLISSAKQNGKSSAIKDLKKSLTTTAIKGSKPANVGGARPIWEIFGSQLKK